MVHPFVENVSYILMNWAINNAQEVSNVIFSFYHVYVKGINTRNTIVSYKKNLQSLPN